MDDARMDMNVKLTINDFEPLVIIGRGAFGEVRLVRMKDRYNKEIYGKITKIHYYLNINYYYKNVIIIVNFTME